MVSRLQISYETGLNSDELKNMSGFDPNRRTRADTPKKMMFMDEVFRKVVNNILPGEGFDQLRKEVELYQLEIDGGKPSLVIQLVK